MNINVSPGAEDVPTTMPAPSMSSQMINDPSGIQRYQELYPFASEPSYFTRPNRYYGPPSTWQSWTAEDRIVADSLDVIRARDLGLHLYNAFDLKRRSVADPGTKFPDTIVDSKKEGDSKDDQRQAEQQFKPPEVWTAWPLRSCDVPRGSDQHNLNGGNHGNLVTMVPSSTLEDGLLATTLRHAKEKWNSREVQPSSTTAEPTRRDWRVGRDLTKQELLESGATNDEDWPSASVMQQVNADSASEPVAGYGISDAAMEDDEIPEGVQFFSSQAFAAPESPSPSGVEGSRPGPEDDHPVFSADDDAARNILIPSVRHTLAKLDDLLIGLHKARLAYTVRDSTSQSRSRSGPSAAERTDDEHLVRSGTRSTNRKQHRKRKRSTSDTSATESAQRSVSRGRSTIRNYGKKGHGLGLRDWSDVLGMATLTSWNSATVARAAERCAALFDQNMTFRTFHQGPGSDKHVAQEEPWFEEEVAYAPFDIDELPLIPQDPSNENITEPVHELEYVRASSPCSNCKVQRTRCHPINSTKPINSTERVPCINCSSQGDSASCSGITIKPLPKSASRACPYPDCPRHKSGKPFSKNYHLQRHLKDVHGHLYSAPASPSVGTPTTENKFELTIREQTKSLDAMTCPVPSCPQSSRVYKRSTRLYDHIKKAHPEVDISVLKGIVAKKSNRGRYDRSRSRSQVRGGPSHDTSDREAEESEHREDTKDVDVDVD